VIVRTLLLLRHATTEHGRPGAPDTARRLTDHGLSEAAAVGKHLRGGGTAVDLVLVSPATRTRQTVEALGLDAPVVVADRLYDAGGDDVLALVRDLADDVAHVLVVGHAPGLPALVHDLADPETSDAGALAAVEYRFPAATLATLAVPGTWPDLTRAALVAVRLP
jgi:phosphohistidine phosphatase